MAKLFLTRLKLWLSLGLAMIRRHIIGPHAIGVLTQGDNGLLIVPSDDFSIGRKLAFTGTYDGAQLERIQALLSPQTHVLIVGGHIGSLAIPIAKQTASVAVVEALPRHQQFLTYNIRLNALNNVTLHAIAASDAEGELLFLQSHHNSGGSKILPAQQRPEFSYDRPETVTVPAQRLDDVLEQQFDIIIMDIEGSEYRALQGMPKLLGRCNALLLEIVPNHIDHVAQIDKAAFLAAFSSHFSLAEIITRTGKNAGSLYTADRFTEMLDMIYNAYYTGGCDVLFLKG